MLKVAPSALPLIHCNAILAASASENMAQFPRSLQAQVSYAAAVRVEMCGRVACPGAKMSSQKTGGYTARPCYIPIA